MSGLKNAEEFVLNQGVLLSEQFSDAEQFNNALDTNVWAQTDSDGNHTTTYSSANSRAEMDGGTTVGSTYIRTNTTFRTPCVVRAKLTTTTLTETNGEVYSSIRLWVGANQWVRWGPYKETAGEDSIGFIKFSDAGDNDQEIDVDATNTDATQREYAIVMLEKKASFYIGNVLKYEMSFTGMTNFYVDLICSTTHVDNAYVDIFWSDFSIRSWEAERVRMLSSFIADGDGDYLSGTRLPPNVSIYDVLGAYSGDGGADYNDSAKAAIEKLSTFVADGDGDMAAGTALASNKSVVDAIGADGSDALSHDFSESGVMQFLHGMHEEAIVLFVIPEAVSSINTHNAAILVELQKAGEVITITQADALIYPDFESITMCVLGTDNGTAWNPVANLAHIKVIPNLPLLSCDSTTAAYFEIGTDDTGDAAAKTTLTTIARIEGTILGAGFHDITGLAAGAANTVSSSTIYNTLNMSDADLTETWYAYETDGAADNTNVVLGEVRRIQPDGSLGVDETGIEVPATMAFYGCAYSFNDLNTLGKAVFRLLCEKLIFSATIGSTLTIAGDIGDVSTKLFGNVSTKFSNASPLAAFIAGNTGGLGTEMPNSVSVYDVFGAFSGDGGAAQDDSTKASLDLIHGYLTASGDIHDVLYDDAAGASIAVDIIANQTDLNTIIAHIVAGGDIHDVLYDDAAGASIAVDIIANQADLNTIIADVGTVDTVVDTNQDLLDGTTATPVVYRREYGKVQIFEKSITAAANVGITAVATVTDQPCKIQSIVIHADAAQTVDMDTCAVEGGVNQVVEFIGIGDATQANLDAADKQVGWTGVARLAATKLIYIDLQGTGATAVDLTITVEFQACADGGYLV